MVMIKTHITEPFALLIILSAFLAMIMTSTAHAGGEPDELSGTTWVAEDIEGLGVMDVLQSRLSFEPDGRITGNGGCNGFFGSAEVQGDHITFGALGSTRMACPEAIMDQEQRFFDALSKVASFEIKNGLLFLSDGSGSTILRFWKLEP